MKEIYIVFGKDCMIKHIMKTFACRTVVIVYAIKRSSRSDYDRFGHVTSFSKNRQNLNFYMDREEKESSE